MCFNWQRIYLQPFFWLFSFFFYFDFPELGFKFRIPQWDKSSHKEDCYCLHCKSDERYPKMLTPFHLKIMSMMYNISPVILLCRKCPVHLFNECFELTQWDNSIYAFYYVLIQEFLLHNFLHFSVVDLPFSVIKAHTLTLPFPKSWHSKQNVFFLDIPH